MTIPEIITEIAALPGVFGTPRLWEKGGHRRIYIDTKKDNGGRNWNGGVGYLKCYIDLVSGAVVMDGVAGAATRNHHRDLGTAEALREIATRAVTNDA